MALKRDHCHVLCYIFFMKRDIYSKLNQWKTSSRRKPLILRGARQVGKTHALRAFGREAYQDVAYINFEEMPEAIDFFDKRLSPGNILKALRLYLKQAIEPGKTLLIFDEVQACPNALNSLKYFCEQANEYHLIAAGSLLGIKLAGGKGFPVGKVNFQDLYPLTFFEFLEALDQAPMREYLEELKASDVIPEPLHQQCIDYLKHYLFVGGMPEAVVAYRDTEDFDRVREIQREILDAYLLDFAKHAPTSQIMKITDVWEVIPYQLAKENRKFIFSAINPSARAREYDEAIQWLTDANLIHKSCCISTPRLPIAGYCDKKIFKVFLLDCGLLGAMSKLAPETLIKGDSLFTEFKGALTENFVAQELVSRHHESLYYWRSQHQAEVDFVLTAGSNIFPLEVKAGMSTQKRSLTIYGEKYQPPILSRASLMNLKQDGYLLNYPLYLISRFPTLYQPTSL